MIAVMDTESVTFISPLFPYTTFQFFAAAAAAAVAGSNIWI